MVKMVTGYAGENHITAADDRARNMGIVGGFGLIGRFVYVLESAGYSDPEPLGASMVGGNTLRILPGEGMLQGLHFRIPYGSFEDLTIENGTAGMNRIDLVVAHYEKNASTDVETVDIRVIKGTATSGTPSEPSRETGLIYSGATVTDGLMYKVWFSGTTIVQIENKMQKVRSLEDIGGIAGGNQREIEDIILNIGTGTIPGTDIRATIGNTAISGATTITQAIANLRSELAAMTQDASGVATYVSNAQFADANGIRYEVRGKTLFITINQSRKSGAASTSDFVEIASIPYQIDNNGANNAFFGGCFSNSATPYQLRFRPTSGATHIEFTAANTTAGMVRQIFAFALV